MKRRRSPTSEPGLRGAPRILDRHGEVIGTAAASGSRLGEGALEVEVRENLDDLLGLGGGTIAVPRSWVAGIRRDEVRLSVAIEDPAFRVRVLEHRPRREPVSSTDEGDGEPPSVGHMEPAPLRLPDPSPSPGSLAENVGARLTGSEGQAEGESP